MEYHTEAAEPLMDFNSNLPEMLAVDLEQSSDIFQSRQLTAGAPAPGLADDGARKRHSPENSSSYGSTFPHEPSDISSGSISQQTIQQKYSDIFAPLDFDPPKRDSISSSDSANMKPPSLSTREESVLTVDTWLEPEKHPSPTFLHISPTSEYTAQMSWIDLDIEDISPITQRRRSSMSDFPQYMHQLNASIESNAKTGRPRRSVDLNETSRNPINDKPFGYSPQIPRRRSSLQHQETQAATQKMTQYLGQGGFYRDAPHSTSNKPIYNTSSFSHGNDTDFSSHEINAEFTFRDNRRTSLDSEPASPTFTEDMIDRPRPKENERDLVIASAAIGFDEWLESDLAYFACEDQLIPRPLPHNVQETIKFFVTNFPEPMLLCGSLLVENIRTLSQEVKYNTDDLKSDHPVTSGQQPNNHQQSKLPKWKWLGSSANMTGQPDRPSACSDISKQGWDVMRKIFPHGSDGLCEALYAYVLVYNYITSLCLRSPSHPVDSSRPTTPWTTTRPNTGKSTASSEFDMYASTPPQPSVSENGIPRKAACILGMRRDDIFTATPSESPTRPRSGGSGGRTATFTSLRSIPSFLFNGTSQGQHRQTESRSATPAGQRNNFSRPATPVTSRAGLRSMTSMGFYAADHGKQLAELRHGVAMCCARLTVTLHRADPNTANRKSDKDCKVDPSFMRSLCENVRITEEAMGRSR
ncbi:hypothetical protein F4678DRAFT_186820 [Xylaria arbuscula]|nr:hypothetical protein F4678DRAFT_186820 [Xylaria arbuscula]